MFLQDPIISIAILLAAALTGGMIAHRLKQPIILGYLIIGVAVGPYAIGLVTNLELIEAAATIGVTLLMFTLGLEISISQLREVGRVGLWGGITQIAATFLLGTVAGYFTFGWSLSQALLFGLIISLSSTAVCLKILMDRGELSSIHGRIMIAILIVQDISVVVMMVILPLIGGSVDNIPLEVGIAIGKAVLFIGAAIVLGRWILPYLLCSIGGVRSRELFLLTVLVLSLGAAIGTRIMGFSIISGAFLVGLILRKTRFVHQALAGITPLRDIFATLFFVSLGMLLDPMFLVSNWQTVLLTVAIIIAIKLLVVFGTVKIFGHSARIALLTGAGLFQIGEFGFILAQAGIHIGIVTGQFYNIIVTSAIITMLFTPLFISVISRLTAKQAITAARKKLASSKALVETPAATNEEPKMVVIAGFGRVGQNVAHGLRDANIPFLIVDIDPERIREAREDKRPRMYGDATNYNVLSQVGLGRAKALVITYPDPMAVVTTTKIALSINPHLQILARFHRSKEADTLKELGVLELISPEYEASFRIIKRLLNIMGLEKTERKRVLTKVRSDNKITSEDHEES